MIDCAWVSDAEAETRVETSGKMDGATVTPSVGRIERLKDLRGSGRLGGWVRWVPLKRWWLVLVVPVY